MLFCISIEQLASVAVSTSSFFLVLAELVAVMFG